MGFTVPNTPTTWILPKDSDKIDEYIEKIYPLIKRYLTILDDTVYVNQPKYILEDGKKYIKKYF